MHQPKPRPSSLGRAGGLKAWHGPVSPRPRSAAHGLLGHAAWTHHKPQHQRAHALPNLWGDVAAELLQGGEETLEFAELPCPAGWGQVLCGQRSRG